MKKLTAFLLALMLILSIAPTAFATVYTEGYLHYTISDESITITGYFGHEETVTIPAMIAGIPVNTIAAGAFTESGIKELNLPDTITGIEGGAIDAGVVIHYNSNLPSGGQEQPQPTQPDPTQPDTTQPNSTQPTPTQPEPTQPKPTQPTPTQPKPTQPNPTQPNPTQPNPTQPNPTQPNPTQPNPTQPNPTQPKSTQPTQPKPTQPKQSAVPASTEPTYAIEEVEVELALEETAAVTTAQEIPDSTQETVAEAVPETAAVTEPAESDPPKPFAAVMAVMAGLAAAVLAGVLVWKKRK